MFAGRFNDAYRKAARDYNETYASDDLMATFKAMLDDWTNRGYDPFDGRVQETPPWRVWTLAAKRLTGGY